MPFPGLAARGSTAEAILLVLSLLLALAYRLVADGVFGGAALGKRIVGIYVVDAAAHRPCSLGQAAIRMGFLVIPIVYFIELVVLACDGQQRWGDRVARTYVLRRHPKPAPVGPAPRPLNLAGLSETLKKLKTPNEDA